MTLDVTTSRINSVLHVVAAVIGTLPCSVLGMVCLARFLPLQVETRVALAFALGIPLWTLCMCRVLLIQSAGRAWLACAALGLIAGVLAFGVPH